MAFLPFHPEHSEEGLGKHGGPGPCQASLRAPLAEGSGTEDRASF